MRTSGKINIAVIVAAAFLVGLAVMSMFTEPSPGAVGSQFMSALSSLDAEKLTALSYAEGEDKASLLKQWKYMTDVAAPEYTFSYDIKGEKKISEDSAMVWMMFTKHAGMNGAYEERFELPLKKTNDGWRVDVFAMSRYFLPGLPR